MFTDQELLSRIDDKIDPCDNFYQFVCGKFLNETNVPNYYKKWSNYEIIYEKIANKVKTELENTNNFFNLSSFLKMKNYYQNCISSRYNIFNAVYN